MPTTYPMLPADAAQASLIGRLWLPGQGPTPVALRADGQLVDLAHLAPTVSALLDLPDPAGAVRAWLDSDRPGLGAAAELANAAQGDDQRHLLAPCDLQPIKASGVTFVASMLERVIEERAKGDPSKADAVRRAVVAVIGDDLSQVRPGSAESARLKDVLIAQGMWSQYLEVGIGPDAEIFTKTAPMASLGHGAEIGLHPKSTWNNPEPEVVLAVNSRGSIVGATLGNDVNLRDFEGRSALLLGKAKDNNGSCAIGPLIRLFDASFGLDDLRQEEIGLQVVGNDGFVLQGLSQMRLISRDVTELVAHAMGPHHQYPDGVMLFCGTMFAPTQDRGAPGEGFTHQVGDVVTVHSLRLGALTNRVGLSDQIAPWTFGLSALMQCLARRGLLAGE